ncbi:SgcJ/EcaC family oxidoreductase [Myxococcota bacterium]|nr:SgcJ/EcaC family oxidoreductase [Myxococcota bacterium]
MWLSVALLVVSRPLVVTVDDLPVAGAASAAERVEITTGLLAALAKHQIPAVGFVTGRNVGADGAALLDRWRAAGHELGNHSFAHLDLAKTPLADYLADVERGRVELTDYLVKRGAPAPEYFRFPFLSEGDSREKLEGVRNYLARTKQTNLPVTIDTQDWSYDAPYRAAKKAGDARALADVRERYHESLHVSVRWSERVADALFERKDVPQILLLHANAVGASEWDALFTWLKATGHTFARARDVLADPAFAVPHAYVGAAGSSSWLRIRDERRTAQAFREVRALLETQAAAWNRGDHAAFCDVYADDASFISPSGLTSGRAAVLARYRKKYPDARAMGKLKLEVIEERAAKGTEITNLDDAIPSRVHAVSVVARWTLEYPDKPAATGLTQLVLHRRGEGWMIVQDASM